MSLFKLSRLENTNTWTVSVGDPWNLRDTVHLSKQIALWTSSEKDVWHTGRQWKMAICVSAKCRALMGCCVARAREIPISCSAGTIKLEGRRGLKRKFEPIKIGSEEML